MSTQTSPTLPLRARELAAWRRSRGVTAIAVAEELGFTRHYLSHVENGRIRISAAQLERIVAAVESFATNEAGAGASEALPRSAPIPRVVAIAAPDEHGRVNPFARAFQEPER